MGKHQPQANPSKKKQQQKKKQIKATLLLPCEQYEAILKNEVIRVIRVYEGSTV